MRDEGLAAACVLAALGREALPTDAEHIRAYTGAMLIANAFVELKRIRKALTPKE